MVFTKKNVAAHAHTEHLVVLSLRESIQVATANHPPKSFVGSVAFVQYILDCRSAKPCIDSRRITGCASRQNLLQRKLKQKKPLSAKQVIGLEKICIGDVEASIEERVASGFFLHMIYARARHSDAQASGLVQLDVAEGDEGVEGFVEASVTRSKTSYSLERKTRYLPMSAPIHGLIQTDSWAVKWFENMRIAKTSSRLWSATSSIS